LDYYGWSLWTELLTGSKVWEQSMDLNGDLDKDNDEFVPDFHGWNSIFSKLEYVIKQAGLNPDYGGCFHTSSNIPSILRNVGLIEDFQKSLDNYSSKFPIEIGMHSTFGNKDLILNPSYYEVLQRDIILAESIRATTIVEHPPLGPKDTINQMIDELTTSRFIDLLEHTNVTLSWENMPGVNRFFSSLGNLITFRDGLGDKYAELGKKGLINKHKFCLDTGHLLITISSRSLKKTDKNREIDEYLPIFASNLKVFHIHANSGKKDEHLIPFSLEFFDEPSRKRINKKRFLKNSAVVMDWLAICGEHKNRGVRNRHIHLEALNPPFSLGEFIVFGKRLKTL